MSKEIAKILAANLEYLKVNNIEKAMGLNKTALVRMIARKEIPEKHQKVVYDWWRKWVTELIVPIIEENNKPENKARIEAERNTAPNHIAATNPLDLEEVVDKEKEAIRLQLQEYEKELTVLGDSAVAQKRKRWVTDKIYDLKFKLNQ